MKYIKKLTIVFIYLAIFLFVVFILPNNSKYSIIEGSDTSMDESMHESSIDEQTIKYQTISEKVKPYIVKAKVEIDDKTIIGEVIEDKGNGTSYCINVIDNINWYDKYYVTIVDPPIEQIDQLLDEEIEFYVNKSNFTSKTDYFIWVDIYRNETYLLKKDNNVFKIKKRIPCSTGANITPTKRGLYEISEKGTHFYGRTGTYICYNYMQYSGSYLLHSFP